ncbi:MAG: APC family permease [Rhodanobacteraceae bacterium]|nr:APC family permease [Rhodanobacteraceae bacterium]
MTQPASEQLLVRAFGTTLLAAAIVNIIVGGGIFALPGRLAETLGSAAPFAFILGALLMVPVVLCFAAAGSRATATGGPYSYGRDAFGPFAGFSFGALTWISNVTGCAGVAAALVDQAARVWPAAGEGGMRSLLLVLLFSLFAALNLRGVHLGARAIGVLAAAKLTPLVLLVLLGIWFIEPAQLVVPQWPDWEHWGQAMVLVLFAYAGMESALVPTGEVRDPGRTVPRAALAAILFVILLYVGLQLTAQGVLGAALAGDKAPLASTAGALWTPGFTLLLLGAGVSMLGYLHGNILGNSRLLYALGRDGLLPAAVGRVHPRTRVPHVAVLVHAAVALALALSGDFATLALVSGGAVGLLYLLVCIAAWHLQRRGARGHEQPMHLPGGPLIPLIGIAAMGLILASLSQQEWIAIGVALAVSAAIYLMSRRAAA